MPLYANPAMLKSMAATAKPASAFFTFVPFPSDYCQPRHPKGIVDIRQGGATLRVRGAFVKRTTRLELATLSLGS